MQSLRPNTNLLDLVVWSRLSGIKWWNKVAISNGSRGRGLFTTQAIQAHDILLSVPLTATFSFLNFEFERSFPLKATPHDFHMNLPWWPDLDWGTFALIAWLTAKFLTRDPYALPYLNSLPKYSLSKDALTNQNEPFAVMRSIAAQSMRSNQYMEASQPLKKHYALQEAAFDETFMWLYTCVRSRSIPLWSQQGGHEAFRDTSYGKHEASAVADVCCLVPVLDMMNHSTARTNVSVGFPGEDVSEYIVEKSLSKAPEVNISENECIPRVSKKAFIIAQATADLKPGEELLVNYNSFYGFDEEIFSVWFDTPLNG